MCIRNDVNSPSLHCKDCKHEWQDYTGRERVQVYEENTQEEAFEMAYKDGTIIDVAATMILPDLPATERQLEYAESLGINCPDGITKNEISVLIEEAKKWATPEQLTLAEELGLKPPKEKMTKEEMSDFIEAFLQYKKIRKRYEKLPPTKDQLRKAKELDIKIPWFATRMKLSALIDQAISAGTDRLTE